MSGKQNKFGEESDCAHNAWHFLKESLGDGGRESRQETAFPEQEKLEARVHSAFDDFRDIPQILFCANAPAWAGDTQTRRGEVGVQNRVPLNTL
mmetsp:Transcript_69815/g.216757  ORF Transcript_69815/g.216757 Transcript_69815/m.216757 type:complete len:94 (-) Transcript_69815:196-477(-)